uniref:G0/G1 switch protein 2-like n=1 Tax=Centroberyx gerrardi TaxID=166262 RepID=UPI003AB042E6
MESMQELIPFAKEMLSQKPSRGLLKVYLVGSVFAVLGTVIGLVETVCHPFSSGEPLDAEMVLMLAREQRTLEAERRRGAELQGAEEEATARAPTLSKAHGLGHRSLANRLHAS